MRIRKQLKKLVSGRKRMNANDVPVGIEKELVRIDSMLCQSATIARLRYSEDPEHLMKIICSSHVAIESLMKKYGVECRRSEPGAEFDPETMVADDRCISTDDEAMDGKVACSSVPAFYKDGMMIEEETVLLYQFKD